MAKWIQSEFKPKNPQKCRNTGIIHSRSSWEAHFMRFLDTTPSIIQWGSEVIRIPYFNPIKQCQCLYVPDFIIRYIDASGNQKIELIEIKPAKEAIQERTRNRYDKLTWAVNQAKWESAIKYCMNAGIKFRVVTELELFAQPNKNRR